MTSKIQEYIEQRSAADPEFAALARQAAFNLDVAVAVRNLRDEKHMTQRTFAKLVGKPQSTIARIETGEMNVSVNLLNEIAAATGKGLSIQFTDPDPDVATSTDQVSTNN